MTRLCEQCGKPSQRSHSRARFCFSCVRQRSRVHCRNKPASPRQHVNHAVRQITHMAVLVGFLPDPETLECADCGKPAKCYDHRDYNKPLEVEPVCLPCNSSRGKGASLNDVTVEAVLKAAG